MNSILICFQEYEGDLDSVQTYYEEQRHKIETVYRDWLIDSGNLREKPKEKSCKSSQKMSPLKNTTIRSFSALEID